MTRSSFNGIAGLRVAFAGTPEFALPTLRALARGGAEIVTVYTQPDRRAGRGRALKPGPVKRLAQDLQLPLRQPASLRAEGPGVAALELDVLVVVAYGLLIPPAVLAGPRHGCINVHASLLPRWRGAAPIARAIEAGDSATGVTIMRMDAGLDTGPILAVHRVPIEPEDTAGSLHDRLAEIGAAELVAALPAWVDGTLTPTPQDEALATYAPKLSAHEAHIQWADDADRIARQVRAFDPWPVAHSRHGGARIRVWRAAAEAADAEPDAVGTVQSADPSGIVVACGSGLLRITELQRDGGKRLAAGAFLNGYRIGPGDRFE